MSEEQFNLIINLGLGVLFIIVSFFVGKAVEKNHYHSIEKREALLKDILLVSSKYAPDMPRPPRIEIVTGSMVVSSNAFLNLLFSLQSLFGGKASAYESLLDRARREAMLRMKQNAKDKGATMIVHVWMESSRIGIGKSTNGMCEVLAYGSAVIPT